MKQKLLYICLMILCALAWSGEVWGQSSGYELKEKTGTVTITGTSLQSLTSNSGYSDGTVTFKIDGGSYESGSYTEWFQSYNYYTFNLGSTGKGPLTRKITLTAASKYTIYVTSVTLRSVGYASSGLNDRYMQIDGGSKTKITDSSVNPQYKDGNYKDVTSSAASNPIVITCTGERDTSHPFHTNKITVNYRLTYEEEILRTITIANGTTSSTIAGVTTQGTATANDPASGYEFLGWEYPSSVTLATGYSSTDKTIKFNATNNATITAKYGRIYDVTVANNVDATTSTVQAGTIKTANVTASDKTNYEFHQWDIPTGVGLTGGTTINNKTITIQATAENKTITAIYKPVFLFSPTAVPSNVSLGTATVEVTDRVVGNVGATSYTTTATFTAEPKNDCVFLGWFTTNSYTGEPVTTDLSHTENLTSTIGTPGTKTLYALFKKKQNLKWVDEDLDLNLVLGAENLSSAASVTSNKTITYTSSNENALTIATDGAITTIGLGNSTVTAHVDGDDVYRAETITREFNVGERKQATFTPSWGESLTTYIELGETATITLKNVNASFSVTKGEGNYFSWEQTNSNTITITALSAGSTTLTLSQPGDGAYLDGNTTTYTINVVKHPNTFTLAAESKALKVGEEWTNVVTNTGNNNTQVSYSDDDIATYDATENKITAVAEGSTTITFTQAATDTYATTTKTIDITVTKYTNTLSITLPSLETDVEGSIVLGIEGKNNPASIVANITEEHQTSGVNNGEGVISFNATTNAITGLNAGTAKITFYQPATDKYTASQSYTFDITVNKVANAITIKMNNEQKNSLNVARGDQVTLSYTSPSSGDYHIALTSGSTATGTISGNTITAGNTDGTNIWTISQDETYRYEAATATVRIKVNSVAEAEGYVLNDATEYSHGGGSGTIHEYTLSGPGEILTYSARRQTAAVYYNLYAQYTIDGSVWITAQDNTSVETSYKDFTCSIPDNAIKVRFYLENSAGTLDKFVKNVKVTRKTYVRSASDNRNLGDVYTDQTASTTFKIDYSSTNGGNLEIISSNPRFTISESSVTVVNNSDNVGSPKTITVTYTPDPDHLGTDNGTITVSDRYYSSDLVFTATAKKYSTTIARGNNTATETTVEGSIANAFAFTGTSATYPSVDSNADFYYTISHTQTSSFNKGTGVISYDPATNTITGKNQGTARLTIYQKKTDLYNATSQTFDFSVTKLENNTVMSLSTKTLSVDGTATVELMNADSDGALSATYSNISYQNESQNRDGGLLSFAGNTLTGVNAGTGKVTITQAETYKYVAKSQEFNVTVNKLTQTLSWDNPDLETTMQVGSTLEGNTATSDADLTPVTYSSGNASAITVDANTGVLTAVTTGSNIGITASQAGNYKYLHATLTRQFSVFNKQTPAFNADSHFSGSTGRIEYTLTATITITGVSDGLDGDFTITNGDNTVIDVVRDGETITITGLKEGSTMLTLAQAANDDYLAKTQTYNIEVYWPDDFLALSPTVEPTHTAKTYRKVFFNRSLKAGYSTLSVPFNTTVQNIVGTGYNATNDWVAQLSVVTYNAKDGYSLYFNKTNEIVANQPYILHLGSEVNSPVFTNVSVVAAEEGSQSTTKGVVNADQWILHANYDPTFDMDGYYGVVGEKIKKGITGSTLKAYHAYVVGPASAAVKAAYLEEDEADGLLEFLMAESEGKESFYDLQGRQLPRAQQGFNIVRDADGSVKKVMVN